MIYMKIEISKMDHSGNGIGYIDNKIVFVPKAIIGDICEIEITDSKKKYDVGKIIDRSVKSDDYVLSKCPYYLVCGGCNISNLSYEKQLLFKKNKVINIFKRYLDMDIDIKIIPSSREYGYRNKITFRVENGVIGLVDIDNKIIEIDKCLLVSNRINELYRIIKEEDLSKVKKIVIKECDNGLILSVLGMISIDRLRDKCVAIYLNDVCVSQKEDGYIFIDDIKYMVSDKSFFQVNGSNVKNLYDVIVKYGNFFGNEKVIDLYCGVGSISLYISKYVGSVLGIELVPKAIMDANRNKEINKIKNVQFICGDVAKLVDDNINGDVLIVDPPRVGLDKHTVSVINNSGIEKVIYVSCDPMTLVRDIKEMDKYSLQDITGVDMFPQTHHVECVCVLKLK